MMDAMKRMGLAAAVVMGLVGVADAGQITYKNEGVLSGILGGSSFVDAEVIVTFVGDTDNVIGAPGFFTNDIGVATITVSGIGTATFTEAMRAYSNQSAEFAGIASIGQGATVLATNNAVFGSYDLTTAIGPITGGVFWRDDITFSTDLGDLQFRSQKGDTTFTATLDTTAVPEPGTIGMAAFAGVAGLIAFRRRRAA